MFFMDGSSLPGQEWLSNAAFQQLERPLAALLAVG
jgi:hypothetical protein